MGSGQRNEEVCRRTRAIEWSTTIKKRWLKWFGKIIRAEDSTNAKRAFNYTIPHTRDPVAPPFLTWLSIIRSHLEKVNLTWDKAINIAVSIKTSEATINDFKL